MKKWIIGIGILAVLGVAGYKAGMNYASEKMINQVAEQVLTKDEVNELLHDPAIQQSIKEQAGTEALAQLQKQIGNTEQSSLGQAASTVGQVAPNDNKTESASTPGKSVTEPPKEHTVAFTTKEEALKFLLAKFTMDELKGFAGQAQGGITTEEKAAIKSELLSRISPDEFQALKVLGLIELSKQKQ